MATTAAAQPLVPAPLLTEPDRAPHYFTLPAPRGQILDCEGRPLARTTTVQRLAWSIPVAPGETADSFVSEVQKRWPALAAALPMAQKPSEEAVREHFAHRRQLPLLVSDAILRDGAAGQALPEGIEWRVEYRREYPERTTAAHVVGYVTNDGPPLRGPLRSGEALWMPVKGRNGLEATFDEQLSGKPGLVLLMTDTARGRTETRVVTPPQPGSDVVTTLRLEVQRTAETALAASNRPGAVVVMDASTGNVLALASSPTFDPNAFARGIGEAEFAALAEDARHPLLHRAVSSQYPPGSVFKTVVALAGLTEGTLDPEACVYAGADVVIDGRPFHNWTSKEEGWFDLRAAMTRSCNTYFYQVAQDIGDGAILRAARVLGFGAEPAVPLPGVAAGSLPKAGLPPQGIANLAIGQGEVLASPLQVAGAMATLANSRCRPRPRLVAQVQSQEQQVTKAFAPVREALLLNPDSQLRHLRVAMNGVVNHRYGTAGRARQENVRIFGKTGTAQWSTGGAAANAVWFAGFVLDTEPPLAFAVVLEGRPEETILAGSTAVPVAGDILSRTLAARDTGLVVHREHVPLEDFPLRRTEEMVRAEQLAAIDLPPEDEPQFIHHQPSRREPEPEEESSGLSGFFRRVFGRR